MALSKAYIQLIFANERDTYYCEDLRKLDLTRYLWFRLHEEGYDVVYFISEERETGKLKLGNCGETAAREYTGRRTWPLPRLYPSEEEAFVRWVQQHILNSKNAVVVPLELFCRLKERIPNIAGILNAEDRSGSIFLIVPPEKSSVQRLVAEDSIFDHLKTRYILDARSEPTEDYCSFLETKSQNGGGVCLFLHTYTKERLTVLLEHIVLEHFERFSSEEQLAAMGEYLACYLNNRFMQLEEKIFDAEFDLRMPRYEDLFLQLGKEKVWNALAEKVAAVPAGKSVLRYVRETYTQRLMMELPEQQIRRDLWIDCGEDSPEYRCMSLSPCDPSLEENSFMDRARHRRNLNKLWRNSRRISNYDPNPILYGKMIEFLDEFDVQRSQYADDCMTCRRLVYALSLFSENLYNRSLSEDTIRQMNRYLDFYIICSKNFDIARKNYLRSVENGGQGVAEAFIKTTENTYSAMKQQLDSVENGLPFLMDQLTGKIGMDSREKELARDAQEILETWAKESRTVFPVGTSVQKNEEPEPAPLPKQTESVYVKKTSGTGNGTTEERPLFVPPKLKKNHKI